jgi:hypothetical protein
MGKGRVRYAVGVKQWFGAACLAMVMAAPVFSQDCSVAAQRTAVTLRQRQTELLKVKLGDDDTGPEVPAPAQAQIPSYKDAIAAAVDALPA